MSDGPTTAAAAAAAITRHQSNVVERVQALTMYACGRSPEDIAAVTGIKRESLKSLRRRAQVRGWIVGQRLEESFVSNLPKSGRPPVVTAATAQIIEAVAASAGVGAGAPVTREAVAERIAVENPGLKVPSQYTIRRWRMKTKAAEAASRKRKRAGAAGAAGAAADDPEPGGGADVDDGDVDEADPGLGGSELDDSAAFEEYARYERFEPRPQVAAPAPGHEQRAFEPV